MHADPSTHPLAPPTPTLPIILVSVVAGMGSGVLGFYMAYAMLGWSLPWSTAIGALSLLGATSASAAFLSALHDRRTIGINLGFSCGLIALLLAFSGLCLLTGIFAATLSLFFQ